MVEGTQRTEKVARPRMKTRFIVETHTEHDGIAYGSVTECDGLDGGVSMGHCCSEPHIETCDMDASQDQLHVALVAFCLALQ